MKIVIKDIGKIDSWEKTDLLAVCTAQKKGSSLFDEETESMLASVIPGAIASDFQGKSEQSILFYPLQPEIGDPFPAQRVALVGLGKNSDRKESDEINELFRRCGGVIASVCKKSEAKRLSIIVPTLKGVEAASFIEHFTEGVILGLYSFTKYKTRFDQKDDDVPEYRGPAQVEFLTESVTKELRAALGKGKNSAEATSVARDMANEPGNGWTPTQFANFGKGLAHHKNVKCMILEKSDMKNLSMGGLLGVNQGSEELPKLVIVDYCPEKYKKTVMFVGKGLTFDSGGVSIKPSAGMMDMKYDMCGGAAVLSAMQAIIDEKPAVRVVGLVPSTDNMAGGGALKPGDIITHYGGITSEIDSTDAEGRLILADALAYGAEQFKPDCIVDLATLTGAVIIALGHYYVGALSNNDELCEELMAAAKRAGEPQWRLPLDKVYAKQLESKVADLKNTGGRPAGTITAAEYLHKFVGDIPWVHLDIAGTAWEYAENSYTPNGPSGVGTRTLIEFVREKK